MLRTWLYRRGCYVGEDLIAAVCSVFSYVENFFMLRIVSELGFCISCAYLVPSCLVAIC